MSNTHKASAAENGTGKAARTRARILGIAKARFVETGYDAAKSADIARAAGVAEGTIFLHFDTKQGLLAAAMAEFYAELIDAAEEILARQEPGLECLRALLADYVRRVEAEWPLVRDFARFGRFGADDFARAFADHNRAYTALFRRLFEALAAAGVLRSDLSAELYRDMLFGTLEHFAIAHYERPGPHDTHGLVNGLMTLFVEGAGAGDKGAGLNAIEAKLDALIGLAGGTPPR